MSICVLEILLFCQTTTLEYLKQTKLKEAKYIITLIALLPYSKILIDIVYCVLSSVRNT